ncbi:MAG: hypothetical protein QOG67_600 [Verrucomicrobiota bacterium]
MVTSLVVSFSVLAVAVYAYERHHRGPTDSVFVGLWEMEGMCMDCTFYFLLQADHTVLGIGEDRDLRSPGGRGRWYAGGELLVVHYSTAEATNSIVMRIVDIAPDVIRVRKDGREFRMIRKPIPPQASNQAMERTATRCVFAFSLASALPLRTTLALGGRRSSCSR